MEYIPILIMYFYVKEYCIEKCILVEYVRLYIHKKKRIFTPFYLYSGRQRKCRKNKKNTYISGPRSDSALILFFLALCVFHLNLLKIAAWSDE